jgi:hypothetical protein
MEAGRIWKVSCHLGEEVQVVVVVVVEEEEEEEEEEK